MIFQSSSLTHSSSLRIKITFGGEQHGAPVKHPTIKIRLAAQRVEQSVKDSKKHSDSVGAVVQEHLGQQTVILWPAPYSRVMQSIAHCLFALALLHRNDLPLNVKEPPCIAICHTCLCHLSKLGGP